MTDITELEPTVGEMPELEVEEEAKPKAKRSVRKINYIGNGAYLIGIPARDMSISDWDGLPTATRNSLIDQGIFEVVKE